MIIAILKSNTHKIFMEYIKNIKINLHYTPLITDKKQHFSTMPHTTIKTKGNPTFQYSSNVGQP